MSRPRMVMRRVPAFRPVRTDIPARLDRLPWSRWHWLAVVALGVIWALNGLEVATVSAIGPALTEPGTLNLSSFDVGLAATIYVLGAVSGALFFGYLTDLGGRKRTLMVALGVFLLGVVLTAFAWSFWSFALFRFIAGVGIGGEYSAINSIIVELFPARVRGWTSLTINSSYWIGAIMGVAITVPLLNPGLIPQWLGWRLAFGLGVVLVFGILMFRRNVPESPRWLMTHGRLAQANQEVGGIEHRVRESTGIRSLPRPGAQLSIEPRGPIVFRQALGIMAREYPGRSILGVSLMIGQAFFYNSIFFTYGLVLTTFYGIPNENVGLYLMLFVVGNIVGPWTIGRYFDTVGRKPMIAFTYILSGALLAITGWLFSIGFLSAVTQTIAWSVVFFFASAGASAAYLTISEIFPLELRATAIALLYSIGTGVGGLAGPVLFGALIQSNSRENVFYGYLVGAGLMIAAGLVELALGVRAGRRSLESIARPLSVVESGGGRGQRRRAA